MREDVAQRRPRSAKQGAGSQATDRAQRTCADRPKGNLLVRLLNNFLGKRCDLGTLVRRRLKLSSGSGCSCGGCFSAVGAAPSCFSAFSSSPSFFFFFLVTRSLAILVSDWQRLLVALLKLILWTLAER